MTKISKRTFLHAILLLVCDLNQAWSARTNNLLISNDQRQTEFEVVEYIKEHEVTERQARENLLSMTQSDFLTPAYCSKCSAEHKRYCLSENLLKDHCCCNVAHHKEQLYFIPHTCFITNEQRCHPSFGSCLTVMEIRNCCCDADLKRKWKSVLAGTSTTRSSKYLSILLTLLVAANNF